MNSVQTDLDFQTGPSFKHCSALIRAPALSTVTRVMGITSGDLASSGNGLINPFSTASVPVENPVENPVEKEAGSDPIENLLPALLQIFLTVGLSI